MLLEIPFSVCQERTPDPRDPAIRPPPYYRCRLSSGKLKAFQHLHLQVWFKKNPKYGHECAIDKVQGRLMEYLSEEPLVTTAMIKHGC